MAILNERGEPYELELLKEEEGAPLVSGIRNIWHESVANGLTPEKLSRILQSAAEGDADAYLTLAEEMEEREPHYGSVLSTRKLAVSGLPITVEPARDEKDFIKHADAIRAQVERPEFIEMIPDLLDALGKSFSVVEQIWDTSGKEWFPSKFVHRDPHFFRFDRQSLSELRLLDESDPVNGKPLALAKWIAHYPKLKTGAPIRGGLARFCSAAYMCKSFGVKDWMSFLDVYGIPMRVGKYGPGATERDKRILARALAALGTDAAAVIPASMSVEFENAVTGAGADLFANTARWWDEQISKRVLGQTMTSDSGSSRSQAEVHDAVRKDLLRHDALTLTNTLNRYFVRPFINLNYGPQKLYPKLAIVIIEPKDLKARAEALAILVDRGLEVEQSQVLDEVGLEEPAPGAKLLRPAGKAPEQPSDLGGRTPAAEEAAKRREERAALNRAGAGETDPVDEVVAESMSDWEQVGSTITDPIEELFNTSSTVEEFKAGLDSLQLDPIALAKAVAEIAFKSRLLGQGGE